MSASSTAAFLRRAAPVAAGLAYVAAVAVFFVDYYVMVRAATPAEIVDVTLAVILVGAIALPLIVFPMALVCRVIGSFDEAYSADAAERGGVVGADWLGVAALVAMYALPAAAFGVGLRELSRRLERRMSVG